MKKIYSTLLTLLYIVSFSTLTAQTPYASELIIVNGEQWGANETNIASYNIYTKAYEIFDTLGTSTVQDILIDGNKAIVASESKIIIYNLDNKTKEIEGVYPGVLPGKGAVFIDNNFIFVGNNYGQTDSNIYAFNKTTLALEFSVTEADASCGGGVSVNDTLYIGQKVSSSTFQDSIGSIIVANANDGTYYRTIDLAESGSGLSQIYNYGNHIFAVCAGANKIIKVEIGTDVVEEISLAPFTSILEFRDNKIYLDLNGNAGYYDISDGSSAISSLFFESSYYHNSTFDPYSSTAFSAVTENFSVGKLRVYDANGNGDTTIVGAYPEALGLVYKTNSIPVTADDTYEYIYEDVVSEYFLNVLENDTDGDGDELTITSISTPFVTGAIAVVEGNDIKYTRVAGIATTDYFTYTACDAAGACSSSIVHIRMKSTVAINDLNIDNQISVYPNPISDVLNIQLNDLELEKVEIFNQIGKIVKTSKESKINLESLANALYFVKVYTNKGTYTTKFTIYK